MAELKKYGFIVQGSGYVVGKDSAVIDSGFFHTTIMAVANVDDAIFAAKELVKNGIEVIELCGGFTENDSENIVKSINGAVPIGNVVFSNIENEKLKSFLKS
jgi:hypothetical protein